MVKPTGPTNYNLRRLIRKLEKTKRPLFRYVAELLAKPTRRRKDFVVNLEKIEKLAKDGETIIVPGKVLGSGKLTKKVRVVAWRFSQSALEKLKKEGIETYYLEEFVDKFANEKLPNTKIFI